MDFWIVYRADELLSVVMLLSNHLKLINSTYSNEMKWVLKRLILLGRHVFGSAGPIPDPVGVRPPLALLLLTAVMEG